jgi:hypothetical protein
LLINDQTVPKIMGKMPFAECKERATKRSEWAGGDMVVAFEKYVERKWKDALNIAAAEPQGWEASGGKADKGHSEKPAWGRPLGKKSGGAPKRISKGTGAANIVTSRTGHEIKKCKFRNYTGCTEGHAAVSCKKFRALEKKKKRYKT